MAIDDNSQSSGMRKSIAFLLVLLSAAIGVGFTVGGVSLDEGTAWHEIFVGLGIGFISASVIALLYELFASSAAEVVMRNALAQELKLVNERPNVLRDAELLGVERIYRTRGDALRDFEEHLHAECEKAKRGSNARLWVTCTSMRGFFFERHAVDSIIRTFADPSLRADLRILMTHPEHTASREVAENRSRDAIATDIRDSLKRLRDDGVDLSLCVRLHRGSPTVFGIATEGRMLLNPYPHGAEGQSAFAIVVAKTDDDNDIYGKFLADHFDRPWQRGEVVGASLLGSLDPVLDLANEAHAEGASVRDSQR